ncbi:MAG: hypothetical protein WED00_06660 [Aquisalimonadaceae bacterium]
MKLTVLSYETKNKGSYLVSLRYGDQELTDEITVYEGVVPYIVYSDNLQDILHKDVGEAKNMNKTIFKIYREEALDFPVEVGNF